MDEEWGTTGNGFDGETYLANEEKRQEIQQLARLASDCRDELQYAKYEHSRSSKSAGSRARLA
jgi:hypothetical protein